MRPKFSRREFLKLAGASALLPFVPQNIANMPSLSSNSLKTREWITKGHEIPELVSFDTVMRDFMQARNISGGALAITKDSKLVFARGYTWSEDPEDLVVEPTSLFRVASLTKPFTATAMMRLVQDNQLDLDERVVNILTLTPPEGQSADPRLDQVTVRHLLQHLGGWDRDIVGDITYKDITIANDLGLSLPISKYDNTVWATGQPLQHDPGTQYAYSNYGYNLLGQIIETITGQSYLDYLYEKILNPLGITDMMLGRTLFADRLPNEVKYHSQYQSITVMDDSGNMVPRPYGGFNLEKRDSQGGLLASVVDLARFAATFDDPQASPILNKSSIDVMFGLPENIPPSSYTPGDYYYACGWGVRDWLNGYRNTWHTGGLAGTRSFMHRHGNGINWCILFNQRDDPSGLEYGTIDEIFHDEAEPVVTTWPDHDLFGEYFASKVYLPLIVR